MNFMRKKKDVGLVGKSIRVGPYSVRVDVLLAEGGFASVYRVQDVTTEKMLALKHARMGGDREAVDHIKKEVSIMKALRGSPNIVTLRSVSFSGPSGQETEAFLLMDLCDGTLVDVLDAAQGTLPENAILKIFADVCSGVASMHNQSPPIAHRDLKAENVMINSSGEWLLCDFGSATNATLISPGVGAMGLAEDDIRRHTTPSHRAPELWDLFSKMPIDQRVDLWALGCMLYHMAYGQLPFAPEAKLQILNGDYSLPDSRGTAITNLVRDLLQVHPEDRPHISLVLQRTCKALDLAGQQPALQQSAAAQNAISRSATAVTPAAIPFAAFGSPPQPAEQLSHRGARASALTPQQPASPSLRPVPSAPLASPVLGSRDKSLATPQLQSARRELPPQRPNNLRGTHAASRPDEVKSLEAHLAESKRQVAQLTDTVLKQRTLIHQLKAQLAVEQQSGSKATSQMVDDISAAVTSGTNWVAFAPVASPPPVEEALDRLSRDPSPARRHTDAGRVGGGFGVTAPNGKRSSVSNLGFEDSATFDAPESKAGGSFWADRGIS